VFVKTTQIEGLYGQGMQCVRSDCVCIRSDPWPSYGEGSVVESTKNERAFFFKEWILVLLQKMQNTADLSGRCLIYY
jgi:hypothetical protein